MHITCTMIATLLGHVFHDSTTCCVGAQVTSAHAGKCESESPDGQTVRGP